MNKKQNKLSVWFYKQNYSLRIAMVIILLLVYWGVIFITILGGILAGVEYITPILLFVFVCSLILLIWKFSSYFFIPIIIGWVVIFLGSYELWKPCDYHFKSSIYSCDCEGIKQYKLFQTNCIWERKNCLPWSCEEIDNYFDETKR